MARKSKPAPMVPYAKHYNATYGWHLFPARVDQKKSWLWKKNAPEGLNWGMTADPDLLVENFSASRYCEECGIGLPTGEFNNLFVIEADTKQGHDVDGIASLHALEKKFGKLPATLMARSPSGSLHYYFNHPGHGIKIQNSASRLAPGVDVRGDGGMVIAPPSVRRDGVYAWHNDEEIADAPYWLIDAVVMEPRESRRDDDDIEYDQLTGGEIAAALSVIPNDDVDWEEWNLKGMASFAANPDQGFAGFDAWSKLSGKYDAKRTLEKWLKYYSSPPKEITAGSLIQWANDYDPDWRGRYEQSVWDDLANGKNNGRDPVSNGHDTSDTALKSAPVPAALPWPEMGADALHGLAGEVVRMIEPHTEADPNAILLQFLAYFGNAAGRDHYYAVERSRHHGNLFVVLAGDTSKARKGTSADWLRDLMNGVASEWSKCIKGGLSSGEGMIWDIRDDAEKVDAQGNIVVGVARDKRRLFDEREFSRVLAMMKREGNVLSHVIRDAWDGRTLSIITKNNPIRCSNPHISICAHITSDELRRDLDNTSMANGYANRFLFACVKRSKELPFGSVIAQASLDALAVKISKRIEKIWCVEKAVTMDQKARELWSQSYSELSAGKDGLVGAITARAEAQVVRLALIYALLDDGDEIRVPHLKAALAVWKYCEDSARYIFGRGLGDGIADTILDHLRMAGKTGMSRTGIYSDVFGRNVNASKIAAALLLLQKYGLVMRTQKVGKGRPVETWYCT